MIPTAGPFLPDPETRKETDAQAHAFLPPVGRAVFQNAPQLDAEPPRHHRRGGRFAVWALALVVLAAGGLAAVKLVGTEAAQPDSGAASLPSPSTTVAPIGAGLPDITFARPGLLSAQWEFPWTRVEIDPTQGWSWPQQRSWPVQQRPWTR